MKKSTKARAGMFVLAWLASILVACEKPPAEGPRAPADDEPLWTDEVRYSTFSLKNLPANIEEEIVEYLNLEFGAPGFSEPLTTGDLAYVGQFEEYGKPKRYWRFSCREKPGCWATVQPYGVGYLTSMTMVAPEQTK